jgi:hypothetical protein
MTFSIQGKFARLYDAIEIQILKLENGQHLNYGIDISIPKGNGVKGAGKLNIPSMGIGKDQN